MIDAGLWEGNGKKKEERRKREPIVCVPNVMRCVALHATNLFCSILLRHCIGLACDCVAHMGHGCFAVARSEACFFFPLPPSATRPTSTIPLVCTASQPANSPQGWEVCVEGGGCYHRYFGIDWENGRGVRRYGRGVWSKSKAGWETFKLGSLGGGVGRGIGAWQSVIVGDCAKGKKKKR